MFDNNSAMPSLSKTSTYLRDIIFTRKLPISYKETALWHEV